MKISNTLTQMDVKLCLITKHKIIRRGTKYFSVMKAEKKLCTFNQFVNDREVKKEKLKKCHNKQSAQQMVKLLKKESGPDNFTC